MTLVTTITVMKLGTVVRVDRSMPVCKTLQQFLSAIGTCKALVAIAALSIYALDDFLEHLIQIRPVKHGFHGNPI